MTTFSRKCRTLRPRARKPSPGCRAQISSANGGGFGSSAMVGQWQNPVISYPIYKPFRSPPSPPFPFHSPFYMCSFVAPPPHPPPVLSNMHAPVLDMEGEGGGGTDGGTELPPCCDSGSTAAAAAAHMRRHSPCSLGNG